MLYPFTISTQNISLTSLNCSNGGGKTRPSNSIIFVETLIPNSFRKGSLLYSACSTYNVQCYC